MSGEQDNIGAVLGHLEAALGAEGREEDRRLVLTIAERCARAKDVRDALEELAGVEGLQRFALRLFWYIDREGAKPLDVDRTAWLADALQRDLPLPAGSPARQDMPEAPAGPPAIPGTLAQGTHAFADAVEKLKRGSSDAGGFSAISNEALDEVQREAANLQAAGTAEGSPDVVKFSGAVSIFLQYVLDHELLHDVRVVNLLDSASLTLQTAVDKIDAEDFDSLQQTTSLLEDPKSLLE